MIESVTIADTASYVAQPAILASLRKLNFLFGANAAGKTTISRVIADPKGFPTCNVTWTAGSPLETMVFNRDFVERNFNQPTELKGVFTLGEQNIDILNKIACAKGDLDNWEQELAKSTVSLKGDETSSGKQGELEQLETTLQTACWTQKQKHDATFSEAFKGFRSSAKSFKHKILQERRSNSAPLKSLLDLETRAATVFGPARMTERQISPITTIALIDHESNSVLTKRVVGKEDVDIAGMIQKLGNSDWVREGRVFYENNDGSCPFCQQDTPDSLTKSLNNYFDETFETYNTAINTLVREYKTDWEHIRTQLDSTIESPSTFLDVEILKTAHALLTSKIALNIQHLEDKQREPSRIIRLESLLSVANTIESLIDAANVKVAEHNAVISNLARKRQDLTAHVWKYLIESELGGTLTTYDNEHANVTKTIQAITKKIETAKNAKIQTVTEIRELERETTSIQPTVDSINALLSSFGFQSFSIAKSDSGTCYKLVRLDGSDAKGTLSEGERAFVSFLYFYFLLKGSVSESGMTIDHVVVFDDPVSSLDSDVLFIVSSLIKRVFKDIRTESGYIKQVFVLTHNVYFHKEITFNPRRQNDALSDETFWVVRRLSQGSEVIQHQSNPVKTSYELLWDELRMSNGSSTTIHNSMRRILESYFTILGDLDSEAICDKFDGQDKQLCRSLFSWRAVSTTLRQPDSAFTVATPCWRRA